MIKKALIIGIEGQDGYYLAEFLLSKGYQVYGLVKGNFSKDEFRLVASNDYKPIFSHDNIHFYSGNILDHVAMQYLCSTIVPDEIYNLSGQSSVVVSFKIPIHTMNVNANGVFVLLDAMKRFCPKAKLFQASSSEIFGNTENAPQDEDTPYSPVSPYAVSKLAALCFVKIYREVFNIFAVNGILFNHESPRRGYQFVTQKIVKGVVDYVKNIDSVLSLGNLDTQRDWGFAGDYIKAMWLMLQNNQIDDFVISTGDPHTVREFCEAAFNVVGINIEWQGTGIEEKGFNKDSNDLLVVVDDAFFRPLDGKILYGNSSKIKESLGWEPEVRFKELVKIMVEVELNKR